MADSFNDLGDKILNWSNRDPDIFGITGTIGSINYSDTLIADFMRYAADKAYRVLRIPPLEKTVQYTFEEDDEAVINNCIPIPSDLIEFIHLRDVDAFGTGNSIVYNNKSDTRTFHDFAAEKYDPRYTWTRQGNQILVPSIPGILAGKTYEIYYYGRLGALDTTYAISYENWIFGVNTVLDSSDVVVPYVAQTEAQYDNLVTDGSTTTEEAPNWLRDENERIILFGALAEIFAYLGEDDMMQKYTDLFGQEILQLNDEEGKRRASGGNVQINFDGRGMI